MATFAEDWARHQGISVEEARQDIQAWLSHKSNKERWIEEHEKDEED
jgi:hypothetical protein